MNNIVSNFKRTLLVVVAALIATVSFKGEGSAYLFPHILAVTLVLMAAGDIILEYLAKVPEKSTPIHIPYLSIGLGFLFAYIFFSIDIGFYLGGWLCMAGIIFSYHWLHYKQDDSAEKSFRIVKHLIFVTTFCIVMYLLFSVMLKVQIPSVLL